MADDLIRVQPTETQLPIESKTIYHRPYVMEDYRCIYCGRRLFRASLPFGAHIEIPCYHHECRKMNVFDIVIML
jgi:phage FluMu protein Com